MDIIISGTELGGLPLSAWADFSPNAVLFICRQSPFLCSKVLAV